MVISSPEEVDQLVLRLRTLAPMRAEVQVGRDRQDFDLEPGRGLLARFSPGPGTRWREESFYHLNVTAHGGVTPSALGQSSDGRDLGVRLEVVQVNGGGS